jgi:hypothetical protein
MEIEEEGKRGGKEEGQVFGKEKIGGLSAPSGQNLVCGLGNPRPLL